ncbi:MAG: hypothetical protein HC888_02390 [Candidatus Competibacteraceae bacterium]|nr:hypothetical protein [Candidatus Competibacteraceae bacterium]
MNKPPVIVKILESQTIVDYLASRGLSPVGGSRIKYCCPLHEERTPSFFIFDRDGFQYYKCFGCLDVNEAVWTHRGLIRIGDIQVGDVVIDKIGIPQTVLHTQHRFAETVVKIETQSFRNDPLKITQNHRCLVLNGRKLRSLAPYFGERVKGEGQYRFYGRFKKADYSVRVVKRLRSLAIEEVQASEIQDGDYVPFPVFSEKARRATSLPLKATEREVSFGFLPATERAATFYGWYLAKGSYSGRCVKLTLSLKEYEKCVELKNIVYEQFGLESKIAKYPHKNTCELHISSVLLGERLAFSFGQGCGHKSIPIECMNWPVRMQEQLIHGWVEGDGGGTVSPLLAYGMYSLAIQAKLYPSLTFKTATKRKDGIKRQDSYLFYLKRSDSASGFYQEIEGTTYYLSPVKVSSLKKPSEVVDITVTGSNTFTTKLCSIHNCGERGDLINIRAALEKKSLKQVIAEAAKGCDLSPGSDLEYLAEECGKQRKVDDNEIDVISFRLSQNFFAYLRNVDFDAEEVAFMEKVMQKVDIVIQAMDGDQLIEIYDYLVGQGLPRRAKLYHERKEQRRALELRNKRESGRNL